MSAEPVRPPAASAAGTGARGPLTVLVAAALFCCAGYLLLRSSAVLAPPQGHQYACAAASLAGGGGFDVIPGSPLANYAPLYAVLLLPFAALGHEVVPTVYLVNWLGLTLGLLGFYWLARETGLPAAGLATLAFALWAPQYYLLRAMRPDGLAISFTLLALAALLRYGRTQRVGDLALVGAFTVLATTCRYMTALTLLPVLGLAVAWLTAGPPVRRLIRGASVTALAALPTAAWLVRNQMLTGNLFGMPRTTQRALAEGTGLSTNVYRLAKTLAVDLLAVDAVGTLTVVTGELPLTRPYWIAAAGAIVLAAIVFAVARGGRDCVAAFANRTAIVGLVLYPAVYVVGLLVLWTVGNNDPIHTRYVAPVYPFVALAGLALAGRLASRPEAVRALALAAAVVLAISGVKSVRLFGERPTNRYLETIGRKVPGKPQLDLWQTEMIWESPECSRVGRSGGPE
jgi:4-amino-4-deoxy-L-arabinose transferase-like glycosyltransferase